MDLNIVAILITAVLSIGAVGLGVRKYYEPFRQGGLLLIEISRAIEDDKITVEEEKAIINRGKNIINLVEKLLKKEKKV